MRRFLVLVPLRIGVRAVAIGLRGTADVLELLVRLADASAEAPGREAPPPPSAPKPRPPEPRAPKPRAAGPRVPKPRPPEPAGPEPEPEAVPRGEPVDYDAPEPVAPAHVDADVELVDELAEPGAEDGAGAEVRVAEPWDGYRDLRAADVVDRLPAASAAELAAIELYELSARQRQTVIAAVQRELNRRR